MFRKCDSIDEDQPSFQQIYVSTHKKKTSAHVYCRLFGSSKLGVELRKLEKIWIRGENISKNVIVTKNFSNFAELEAWLLRPRYRPGRGKL